MKWYKHPKLYDAFELFVAEQNERLPNKETLSQVTFSEAFRQRMRQMTARRKWGYYVMFGTAGRRVASILVALLVATTVATISVDAIREPVARFFTKVFRTHTVIHVDNDDVPMDETKEMELYAPTYIPEGYALTRTIEIDGLYSLHYTNEKGDTIRYSQDDAPDGTLAIDTEGTTYREIKVGEHSGIITIKGKSVIIGFWTDRYGYTLDASNSSEEEMMKMALSIEKVDKDDDGESMVLHAPTYIPEGYTLTKDVVADPVYRLFYSNENGDEIRYVLRWSPDSSLSLDTEETVHRKIMVGDHPGVISSKNGRVILAFWTEKYNCTLTGYNSSEEEMMKMALSIEKVDKAEATPPTE